MRKELVEVYSDKTNAAVMKHPDRGFPGVLLQGDMLHRLCQKLDASLEGLERSNPAHKGLNEVRNELWELKTHYKSILAEHDISMPFSE